MKPQDAFSWVEPDSLDGVAPSDAFVVAEDSEFYEERMSFFFSECVKLNTDLYIMRTVDAFPFDVFSNHAENTFWGRVLDSMYEATLMRFSKLADDTAHDVYSLPPFRTWVIERTKDQHKEALRGRLARCRFEKTTEDVRKRIRSLRTNYIAHLKKDFVLGNVSVPVVSLSELGDLLDSVNRLLDALSFGRKHMMLPVAYSPGVQHPDGFTRDIDELLDSVARNSIILNQPEESPRLWQTHLDFVLRERPDELAWITKYRRKFGLPTPWSDVPS